MNAWISRNTVPILLVLAGSAAVIVAFEVLDAVAGGPAASPATATEAEAGDELQGIASLAGLIKVSLFLLIPGAITLAVRRGLEGRGASA